MTFDDPFLFLLLALSMCVGLICDCCEQACDVCADDFNRSDSSDVSSGSSCGWTEVSGTWSIESNKLKIVSTDAVLTSNAATTHAPAAAIHISATVNAATNGDVARIIFGYQDANNYLFAELTIGTSGALRLYRRVSGSNTQVAIATGLSLAAATDYTFKACLFDDHFAAMVAEVPIAISGNYVSAPGNGYGLGTGSSMTSSILFDNFVATKTIDGCEDCPDCNFFSDGFDRANSTDLGADWTEVVGDWSINSNQLRISATPHAVVACNTPNPAGDGKISIEAHITIAANGDKARLMLDYQDEGNYLYGEIERTALNTGRVAIGRRTGGTDVELFECGDSQAGNVVSIGNPCSICANLDASEVTFRYSTNGSATGIISVVEPTTREAFAMGTGDACSGNIDFNTVSASRTEFGCAPCVSNYCEGGCHNGVPGQLQLVASGFANKVAGSRCINTCGGSPPSGTFVLDFAGRLAATNGCRCEYAVNLTDWCDDNGIPPPIGDGIFVRILGDAPGTEIAVFYKEGGINGSTIMSWQRDNVAISDCRELNETFDSGDAGSTQLCDVSGASLQVTAL